MVSLWFSLLCLPLPVYSVTYEVGPAKTYANIGDVPWEGMNAGANITGGSPGFVDTGTQNYHLDRRSPGINAGASLHPDAYPVAYQYVKHGKSETRPADGKLDLGAFELPKSRALPSIWLLLQ